MKNGCGRLVLSHSIFCVYHYYQDKQEKHDAIPRHAVKRKEYLRLRYERLKRERKCVSCCVPIIEGEGAMCINCRSSIKGVLKYETAN